ncbi:MAG TPA: allophanate hydrolase [Candidatus Didemnitutus sp.]|nr:allophanate hydrolase [Candidatus Didemnitutus sp.]
MNFPNLSRQLDLIADRDDDSVWITKLSRGAVEAAAAAAPAGSLRGLTFAIKDNIDLAGVPTTAACPAFAYTPTASAPVVDRLVAAGAVPLGKTNLDQFATGLVGVRSPYGVPRNPFGAEYLPGGSSAGSAVAVAAGLCDFSLGTDTAGSGRVPAAFNNLVGLKPTKGLLSTRGVVPACRSLDCVSIFTRTVAGAADVLAAAAAFDPADPFSRTARPPLADENRPPRIGVPRADQLEFFGNADAARLFAAAVERWRSLGTTVIEIDYAPFAAAARLLYEGPWVAERYAAIREFIERQPEALHPVTRRIIEGARTLTAVQAFEATYRLAELRREADAVWERIDALLTPTAGTIYRLAEVEADPIRLNSNLGYYTNHMNLLDLCGLALPAGFLPNGLPWGVTISAPAFCDDRLLRLGARFLGEPTPKRALVPAGATTRVAVCGAHLTGLPLNGQLTRLGAKLVQATKTAPTYRLFALAGTTPPKPGLVRVAEGGASIAVEVWELSTAAFGHFVAAIPAPLGIGTLVLEDGTAVQGFLCESVAVAGAHEVTSFGGWRAYLASKT